MKELTLLQVTEAGRGARAGTYSQSQSFDLCSLPRESLLEQVLCQAGWEQLVLSPLLPTPRAAAGASGPLRTSYMQAGDRERALRHLSGRGGGAILVRITFLSSLLLQGAGLVPLRTLPRTPSPEEIHGLYNEWTGEEIEKLQLLLSS